MIVTKAAQIPDYSFLAVNQEEEKVAPHKPEQDKKFPRLSASVRTAAESERP